MKAAKPNFTFKFFEIIHEGSLYHILKPSALINLFKSCEKLKLVNIALICPIEIPSDCQLNDLTVEECPRWAAPKGKNKLKLKSIIMYCS